MPGMCEKGLSSEDSSAFSLALLLGPKYVSITQSGALGNARLGMIYFDSVGAKLDFNYNNWSSWLQFNSYKFQFESPTGKGAERMNSLDLGASYQWLLLGLGSEELPLFKSLSSSSVSLANQNIAYLSLGLKKEFKLPVKKLTTVNLKASLRYPVGSFSSNTETVISSLRGYGFRAQAEIARELFRREDYSLNLLWSTYMSYQSFSENVSWGTSHGSVSSVNSELSTLLGVQFKF